MHLSWAPQAKSLAFKMHHQSQLASKIQGGSKVAKEGSGVKVLQISVVQQVLFYARAVLGSEVHAAMAFLLRLHSYNVQASTLTAMFPLTPPPISITFELVGIKKLL